MKKAIAGALGALVLAATLATTGGAEPQAPVPLDYAGMACHAGGGGAVLVYTKGAPVERAGWEVNLGGVIAGDADCAVAVSGDTLIVLARGTDGQYFREAAADHWTDPADWSPWQRVGAGPEYHTFKGE